MQWRPVAPNTIYFNATINRSTVTVNYAEVHIVFYRRYARWQRFLINVWENLCDMLDPSKYTSVLDIAYKNLLPYTNVRHPCPYLANETMFIVAQRLDMKNMKVPLIPAGEYRVDFTLTYGRHQESVLFVQLYFDISDHRSFQY